jgi:hypothetical protein
MKVAIAPESPTRRGAPRSPDLATSPRRDDADRRFVGPGQGRSEASTLPGNAALCASRSGLVGDPVGRGEDRVHPGQNGPIFPAGQIPALARRPTEALADRDHLRAWGERSLDLVSSHSQAPTTPGPLNARVGLEAQPAREAA